MTNNKLDPNWVTDFIDAKGCFMINITKRKTNKKGSLFSNKITL